MAINLSKNFTLEELVQSNTAKIKGIKNTPDSKIIASLTKLCKEVLQPIRDKYGKAIIVTSGYRCPQLNTAIGGAKTSQHMQGEAADIKASDGDNKALFNLIKRMVVNKEIVVGQLIDEYGYKWIHVSSSNAKKKNQILHLK